MNRMLTVIQKARKSCRSVVMILFLPALLGPQRESCVDAPMPETLTVKLSHDVHLRTKQHAIIMLHHLAAPGTLRQMRTRCMMSTQSNLCLERTESACCKSRSGNGRTAAAVRAGNWPSAVSQQRSGVHRTW